MAPPSLPVSGQARLMPGVLLLAVGVLAQGTVSLTIEETPEWKACVANPKGCKQLNFMAYSGLEGKIPPSVGDFINLDWLLLSGNNLSGNIPPEIGNCVKLTILRLDNNQLTGKIPTEIRRCTRLKRLGLNNNNLEGEIPGNDVWEAMEGTLIMLRLQSNKLTGGVPTHLFHMAVAAWLPLTSLNVGDNLLSGPVPLHWTNSWWITLYSKPFILTKVFSELWLVGNNWDGGPCVALCGGVNAGSMDDAKRNSTKVWANKCLEDTESHANLPESEYYIDESGRCSFKSLTCGKAYEYVASRTIVNLDCKRCPVHTFQNKSEHKETECYPQPTCNRGFHISKDNNDTREESRSCNPCPTDMYQDAKEHRLTECIAQPTCTAGQFITKDDKTARRVCNACPAGQYQDESQHRYTECIKHPSCPTGTEFEITSTEKRNCIECGDNEYQDSNSNDANALKLTCIAQPNCTAGQFITKDDKTVRRVCTACPAGQYQNKSSHRDTECIKHPSCPTGTEFEITSTEERKCTPCGDNEYQDSDDANALQLTCIDQPTCTAGQFITKDDKTVRRVCTACPAGQYQNKSSHRDTECIKHPSCPTGTEFEITSTEERKCTPCGDNEYQDSDDANALQLTCIDQPTCTAGQFINITKDDKTARHVCTACPAGQYQNKPSHRETECIKQRTCSAGTEFTTTFDKDRTCIECGENEYQDSSDVGALQTTCIDQTYCAAGQKISADIKTERRQCNDCPAGQYQDHRRHRNTSCTEQPKCGPGTLFKGTLYAERSCDACPLNTYQTASEHNKTTCIPRQGCLPQQEFVGNSTTEGRCEPCKEGTIQPKNNHFDKCFDTSLPTTVCNDAGELNAATDACDCNAGFAGFMCEFSDEETCNDHGSVSYNAATQLPSCSNCNNPAVGVGEWCQFSNSKTCKNLGSVSADGMCKWNPEVSECPPGYYYNPNPETSDTENEDAIEVGDDKCYPCSPGEYASKTARRVRCDVCPTLQTSEAASTSESDCFAKFQTAADNQQFCYGEGTITSEDSEVVETKPLSKITTSEDCSSSAAALGFAFEGEYVLPYAGCMYDAMHQRARFYVDQRTYDQALSAGTGDNTDGNTDRTGNNDNDNSRQRRKEHRQYQQRQRKQQQPREQDQQPRKHHHQKRRRKRNLVPKKDTPLCEFYVCKDPDNTVIALSGDLSNAAKTPSCRVSIEQTQKAYDAEQVESQSIFMPAALSITGAALVSSYVQQYRSTSKAGQSFTIMHHASAWLTSLRIFDMLTDFGFYFVSLHGGAFLEAYGDGDPETNPYEEPKVAAFLFISVFCTALGLFMTPLDVWAMSQRAVGGGMSIVGIVIVLSITLFEDTPQLALASIYITTMQEKGIEPDTVSKLSLGASALSMLFNVATVMHYTRKLRAENPTGWWKGNNKEAGDTSDQTARIDAVETENAALKEELAQLKSKKKKKKKAKKQARSTVETVSNPVFDVDANANDGEYLEVQDTLAMRASNYGLQIGDDLDETHESDLEC